MRVFQFLGARSAAATARTRALALFVVLALTGCVDARQVGSFAAPTADDCEDAPPLPCFEPEERLESGELLCHEGTRYCHAGHYGACEDVRAYALDPAHALSALVDPKSAPQNCTPCDVRCFETTDRLVGDGGPVGGVKYSPGGGIMLPEGDAGVPDAGPPDAGDASVAVPSSGCGALAACCTSLSSQPAAEDACTTTVAAGDDAACDAERQLYCPSVIAGPIDGCVMGASAVDSDCDGIPDAFDECTPATVASDMACNGSVLPIATTTNQTIFHVLAPGQGASNSLEVSYKVQNADVYFLMDMTDTMSDERDALVNSLTTGDLVDCALLKNCCDKLTGSKQSSCLGVVSADSQSSCKSKTATYCSGTKVLDCPDLDEDGMPDNGLKSEGIIGAIRCLVGSSWFGAGFFRDIPARDGVNYSGLGGQDTKGIQDRGNQDEQAFRHWVDMTPDYNVIDGMLQQFTTAANYDYPEGDVIALYSLATGKGHMFGNAAVSIAERAGAGCPSDSFGYPCFRSKSIPIVLMFTDDPISNGPPVYKPQSQQTPATYDPNFTLYGKAPSSGAAVFTPRTAETFASALELGDVTKKFVIASGDTRFMSGDYTAFTTGCFAVTSAPDAVYHFTLNATDTVPFAINVTQDPLGYDDSVTPPNLPTPATEFPVVMSLYRGDPTSGGSLLQCKRVCPAVPPFNSCRPLTDSCTSSGQCCSKKCKSKKCTGADPAGTQACFSAELATTSFTAASLPAGSYYMTVKGRRATEKGFYELQIGDPNNGSAATKYTPPSWAQTRDALTAAGIKVLPILSCKSGSNSGRCDGAADQAREIALATGAKDKTTGKGLLTYIDPDGSGLGTGLVMAIRDLANYLAMDITVSVVGNPGFDVQVQKCNQPGDPSQAACKNYTEGCDDPSALPRNTITACQPGATPVFLVQFKNPAAPDNIPKNPADPNGGYHFELQLTGNHQHLLERIPVYIIPSDSAGPPPPPPPPPPTYVTSGSYQQDVYGAGCFYYLYEGEGTSADACSDGKDNDGDGKTDDKDEDCMPGSCLDGKDNDGDGATDLSDSVCQSNQRQDWSDLLFKADVPYGTSIDFALCTANDMSELASCSYVPIAHVSSGPMLCANNADCKDVPIGGTSREGFCGTGGQCQVIDPPKLGDPCMNDADCPNQVINGNEISSRCDATTQRCLYRSLPVGVSDHLSMSDNGRPFARLRVTLNASVDRSKTPTVFEWSLEYVCRSDL